MRLNVGFRCVAGPRFYPLLPFGLTVSFGEKLLTSDPLPPVTTGSYRVAQLIARQKPFPVDFLVPIADDHDHDLDDLTFAGSTRQARADIQFS